MCDSDELIPRKIRARNTEIKNMAGEDPVHHGSTKIPKRDVSQRLWSKRGEQNETFETRLVERVCDKLKGAELSDDSESVVKNRGSNLGRRFKGRRRVVSEGDDDDDKSDIKTKSKGVHRNVQSSDDGGGIVLEKKHKNSSSEKENKEICRHDGKSFPYLY